MNYQEFLNEWHNNEDHIICHTSGSTGTPKEIRLSKKIVIESAERTNQYFGLGPDSVFHSCISPDYIGGKMMAVRADVLGAILTFEEPSNKPLRNYKGPIIDLLAVVPSQMIYILDNIKHIPEIRNIIIGGAKIPEELRIRIASSGLNAYETYGMTETASHIALRKVTKVPSPFRILNGISIKKDSEDRLIISIKSGNPEILKFHTNDLVEILDEEKKSFQIIGRYDNIINTGGKKVNPEIIEEILEKNLGCSVLISSKPDSKWGEKIIMIIEDNRTQEEDSDILATCRSVLPSYAVPKEIIHTKIEFTPNGKKKRKQ